MEHLLEAVAPAQREAVLAVTEERRFRAREVVFHDGDPADSVHLVEAGRFAVRRTTPLGERAIFNVLGPGQSFGELALLGPPAARSATVAALEPARTRVLRRDHFERLRATRPDVAEALLALLADEVRRLTDLLVDALYLPADRRICRRLLQVATLYGDEPPITVPLTQAELAALAGASRITVNRLLREEQARGSVELRRGRAVVLDVERLRRRAR